MVPPTHHDGVLYLDGYTTDTPYNVGSVGLNPMLSADFITSITRRDPTEDRVFQSNASLE